MIAGFFQVSADVVGAVAGVATVLYVYRLGRRQ